MTNCAVCGVTGCRTGTMEGLPADCPMATGDLPDSLPIYHDPEVRRVAQVAAQVEAEGYMRWTRVEETMEFARRLGFTRLGLAFCAGLREEARILARVLRANGFTVISAMCKTGSVPKEEIGLLDCQKVRPGTREPMCNNIGQALLMNRAGTQLNIIFGLCVGHDALFIKHSEALVTCLVAKDRVLAHNPIGALNTSYGYYRPALYESHKAPGGDK